MFNSMNFTHSDGGSWTVSYRRPGELVVYYESTQNVDLTVSVLEAQGFIIIDIVDDSYAIEGVMSL